MPKEDLIELTVDFFKAIESKDWYNLSQMLTDDFQYFGPTPDPFDKETWLSFEEAVGYAFPDWSYNLRKAEQTDSSVEVTVHITGTHTQELKLPWKGIKPLPPTGKKISMPIEHAELKFKYDQVSSLTVVMGPHGSLPGLLEQLGME